jgi:hypothetical protein
VDEDNNHSQTSTLLTIFEVTVNIKYFSKLELLVPVEQAATQESPWPPAP